MTAGASLSPTQDLSDLTFDELDAQMHREASTAVAQEMAARAKGVMLSYRAFVRQTLMLHRARYVAVVDLEATCYAAGEPQDLPNEVIEVGLTVLDTLTGTLSHRMQWYVKPTVSHVTPFCTELTGITPETVASGITYPELVAALDKFASTFPAGALTAWVSYGEADPNYFLKQSEAEGVAVPWQGMEHYNMKVLAGLFFGFGKKKNPGLKKALGLAKLEMEGQHHSGVDDAHNAARLLRFMLLGSSSQA